MGKIILILTILILCVSGCTKNETGYYQSNYDFSGIDTIAIVAINGQVQNAEAKMQISDLFMMELLDKGYAPIPLSQSLNKLSDIKKSENITFAPDDYATIGQLLQVPAVLVINVPYIDSEISISAQLIDSIHGSVLWMDQDYGMMGMMGRGSSSGRNQEDYLMDPLLMFQAPPKAEPVNPLVKAGNRAFKPNETESISVIISNICSTLPSAKIYRPAPTLAPGSKLKSKTKTNTSSW